MVVMGPISGLITTIARLDARSGLERLVIITNIRLEALRRAALRDRRPGGAVRLHRERPRRLSRDSEGAASPRLGAR